MTSGRVAWYHPYIEHVVDLFTSEPVQYLAVGLSVPDVWDHVSDLRWARSQDSALPMGYYVFDTEDALCVMEVVDGAPEQDGTGATPADIQSDHPLANAWAWFEHLWVQGELVARPRFHTGAEVIVLPQGADGTVVSRRHHAGGWMYYVRTNGKSAYFGSEQLQDRPIDEDPIAWVRASPASAEDIGATLTQKKLDANLSDTVFSFRSTRTIFRPYQFKPVLKLLDSGSSRMLIADEVGLGKTIEAGLVWTELEARGRANRVLVISPSSLVAKWQSEMEERFGFLLEQADSKRLSSMFADLEAGKVRPRESLICSIEALRVWPQLDTAVDLGLEFDLILVDEAHALRNAGTKSYELGSALDAMSEAIIFLSATPLNLGDRDLFNLLDLLQPGEFPTLEVLQERLVPNHYLQLIARSMTEERVSQEERRIWFAHVKESIFGAALLGRPEYRDLAALLDKEELSAEDRAHARRMIGGLHALSTVLTRTRKVDVQEEKPTRQTDTIEVTLTPAEERFSSLFHEWCEERAADMGQPVGFVMQMPLRLVSSCIPAARLTVLDNDDVRDEDDDEDGVTSIPSRVPPSRELVRVARDIEGTDSKYVEFRKSVQALVRDGHQLLVFTFSKATIRYLTARLRADGLRVGELHGGVHRHQRQRVMKDFRQGSYDLVVANRVASEGLDFEFCSAIINYDLPWNPMEIEQRIGRIDRIGQRQPKIYIRNFHVPGTIETDIIARVLDRIEVFKRSIGELEPIIGPELRRLRQIIFDFSLSPAERERRAAEIAIAAINREHDKRTVASASDVVLSGDFLDIEGLEEDLVKAGRYVGPSELAGLVSRWVMASGGRAEATDTHLTLRGNAGLAAQVDDLVARRLRSRAEVAEMSIAFRNEQELSLSLNWEDSRQGGLDLLTPGHPLVVAAKARPAHRTSRYGAVRLASRDGLPTGEYLVLLAEAIWIGHRPSREIWGEVLSTKTGRDPGVDVTAHLWADLAQGRVQEAHNSNPRELRRLASRLVTAMLDRRAAREGQLMQENEAFTRLKLESRRVQYDNRVASIDRRLEGLDINKVRGRRLFESMRAKAQREYEADRAQIEARSEGSLEVEQLCCVLVEVG